MTPSRTGVGTVGADAKDNRGVQWGVAATEAGRGRQGSGTRACGQGGSRQRGQQRWELGAHRTGCNKRLVGGNRLCFFNSWFDIMKAEQPPKQP